MRKEYRARVWSSLKLIKGDRAFSFDKYRFPFKQFKLFLYRKTTMHFTYGGTTGQGLRIEVIEIKLVPK